MAIGLSGTMITSKPEQLVSQLDVLGIIDRFGGKSLFRDRYAPFGDNTISSQRAEELHDRMRSFCYIRRRNQDIYADLPDPLHITVRVEGSPSEMSTYKSLEKEMVEAMKNNRLIMGEQKSASSGKMVAVGQMGQMNRSLGIAKIGHAVRWVKDFLEDTDEKVLVFAHHIDVVEGIAKGVKAPFINGKTSTSERQRIQNNFQNQAKERVIVANVEAAGIALTLTAATHILFAELGFVPATHQQAIGRAYGRANDVHGVMVHWMIVPDTLDERMLDILATKGQMAAAVIDGNSETGDGSVYNAIYSFYMGEG